MKTRIIALISRVFHVREDEIDEFTPLEEIIKDSMNVIELLAVLSTEFDATIDPAALNTIETVGDVVAYVEVHEGELGPTRSLDSF